MAFDKDIDKIVNILGKVFPNISYQNKQLSVNKDYFDETSINDKVCEKLVFLYTKPIVDKPLLSSTILEKFQGLFGKEKQTPFGIIADNSGNKLGLCDTNEVKQLQKYFYYKLKILVFLNQISGENNKYYRFYLENKKAVNDKTRKSIEENFRKWKSEIQKIINNVKSDVYNTDQLESDFQKFTSNDPTTETLCKLLVSNVCDDKSVSCENINILSVGQEIKCRKRDPKQEKLIEPESISEPKIYVESPEPKIKSSPVTKKYKSNDDFIETVKNFYEDNKYNAWEKLHDETLWDRICVGDSTSVKNIELSNIKDEMKENLSNLLLVANYLYSESNRFSEQEKDKINQKKKDIQAIKDLNLDSIESIDTWIKKFVPDDETETPTKNPVQIIEYRDMALNKKIENFTDSEGDRSLLENTSVKITRGDGNCLLHAFLMSVSENYRKADSVLKEAIGIEFRNYLRNNKLYDNNPIYKQTTTITDGSGVTVEKDLKDEKALIGGDSEYLTDDTIFVLCSTYKINVFLFNFSGEGEVFDFKLFKSPSNSEKYIFMFLAYQHYSCVSIKNKEEESIKNKEEEDYIIKDEDRRILEYSSKVYETNTYKIKISEEQ